MPRRPAGLFLLLLAIAISTPTILLAEGLIRRLLGADLALAREALAGPLAVPAWVCAALSIPVDTAAVLLGRHLGRRRPPADALIIAASLAQLPALAAAALHLLGAPLRPALLALAGATIGVLLVGLVTGALRTGR